MYFLEHAVKPELSVRNIAQARPSSSNMNQEPPVRVVRLRTDSRPRFKCNLCQIMFVEIADLINHLDQCAIRMEED